MKSKFAGLHKMMKNWSDALTKAKNFLIIS